MAVNLSVKGVPDWVVVALRARAARNHRSLQGELREILGAAVQPQPFDAMALWEQARTLQLSTPGQSLGMIRRDRRR